MIKTIQNFLDTNFYEATANLLNELNILINEITTLPIDKNDLFDKQIVAFEDIETIYVMGMIDDAFFKGSETKLDVSLKKDYEGVLIFAVELSNDKQNRKTLADISRALNREYQYTPIIVIFKYGNLLSLSNTQRQEYSQNQKWRGGEKTGKVTILRDIDITNPHSGHIKILQDMQINTKKSNQVTSYEELYTYWQSVFDVSILNKSFYKELSNWYFWTLKENNVSFPNAPKGLEENAHTIRHEHNAKNVIRLLTRLLFVWFMKEKKLIPDELFEEKYIKDNLLKEFEPKKADGLFKDSDRASKYYKAVLQNLFFATLNQEMGKRAFRLQNSRGQHQNITNLMRYEKYFTNPSTFIELVEKVVPFMNGGLFECLDKPHPTLKGRQGGAKIIYEDGFSDREDNELIVPDYVFFGLEEHVDLSSEYGTKGKANKDTKIKGLINILNSYKFTVAENTPIEEDVALDPELLGKVFENLLASYNPETKTTARKQTGSFYTPREIVSYMVDESLIAYLKTKLEKYEDKEELDKKLHKLLAYDDSQPFEDKDTILQIIHAIDTVKILDPAVGSGAFPMGTLQKMVHLLHKLDPNNEYWQDLQLEKANKETNEVFKQTNKSEIKQKIDEILEAFDENINHPDYARKLYLIENSIFGVDIQPIAIQISKLRFFISLVVEQNVNNDKPNFGIRPLPNLESKFVTANTLIGIDKKVDNLFEFDDTIKELEEKLKTVRHKIFNTKVPKRKRELKEEDKSLREEIATELIKAEFETSTAKMLSGWDPYDQNASSPFFDMEWMFGIEDGFDIVIGNPPYFNIQTFGANSSKAKQIQNSYPHIWQDKSDILFYFIAKAIELTKNRVVYITSNAFLHSAKAKKLRNYILDNAPIDKIINFEKYMVFDSASITSTVIEFDKNKKNTKCLAFSFKEDKYNQNDINTITSKKDNFYSVNLKKDSVFALVNYKTSSLNNKIDSDYPKLNTIFKIGKGMETAANKQFLFKKYPTQFPKEFIKKRMSGDIIKKYKIDKLKEYILYFEDIENFNDLPISIQTHLINNRDFLENRADKKRRKTSTWWNYTFPMHKKFYKLNKIWCSYRAKENIFCFDDTKKYIGLTNTTVIFDTNNDIDLRYLLALLNSRTLNFRYKSIGKQTGGGIYEYFENGVGKLPIPIISKQEQQPFINIVDKIIKLKANEEDTTTLETQLDNMIYELYGLSDDEIEIVEGR